MWPPAMLNPFASEESTINDAELDLVYPAGSQPTCRQWPVDTRSAPRPDRGLSVFALERCPAIASPSHCSCCLVEDVRHTASSPPATGGGTTCRKILFVRQPTHPIHQPQPARQPQLSQTGTQQNLLGKNPSSISPARGQPRPLLVWRILEAHDGKATSAQRPRPHPRAHP